MKLLWTHGLTLVGALAGLLAAAPARAEQIVLFDITYTHTNANDTHHSISGAALNQPANWTSPIDYTKGTIHFYQEVMTKPSTKPTIIDFCLISARDYGCIETFIYTHTGLHETVRSMAGGDVDKRNVIDFTQRMRSIQMVLKTPAPTWINGGRPQSDYLPSMMRFVATLVSPGGTYMKPAPTPGFNPGDGGAAASPADASVSPTTDAAAPGTGGSSGSGGSGGTGGSGGSGGGGSGGSGGSTDAAVVADAASGTTTPPSPPPAVDAAAPSNPPPRPPTPSPGSGGQSGSSGGASSVAGGCAVGGDASPGGRRRCSAVCCSVPGWSDHSARNATIGSTRAARRAGSQQANIATATRAPASIGTATDSWAGNSAAIEVSTRATAIAPAIPKAPPARASISPCFSTRRKTWPVWAPRAMRTPISRRR